MEKQVGIYLPHTQQNYLLKHMFNYLRHMLNWFKYVINSLAYIYFMCLEMS